MGTQLSCFAKDLKRMLGKHKVRVFYIWLNRAFWGIFQYRVERSLYLVFGKSYQYIRIILLPIYNLIQAYSNLDISYKAKIEGGLLILHPAVGVVISGYSVIGLNLTLTGGNVIGANAGAKSGDIRIGNNCMLGANAAIIGPIELADNIVIGALACVIKDCLEDGAVLVGVPAKNVGAKKISP